MTQAWAYASGHLAELADRFAQREPQGRTTTDIAQAARAATYGAVTFAFKTGAEVLAVRRDDIPGRGELVAILRYAF